ncbi:hypothetical protein C0991_000611 [Blastosporella zonata]|nr:hypothetical protein C0991_000611 [Blastosporella zonata]
MDPHGADQRGNPLGGLVYSNAYTSNKNAYTQVIEWHNFMGSNTFCFKACDPSRPNAAKFCQHIYDRIGCAYNAPSNAQPGVFESCQGDNQDYPGVYTNAQGKVQTYTQPPESLGEITSMPYVARVPASSECVRYSSAALFAGSVSPGGGAAPGGGVTVTGTSTATSSAVVTTTATNSSSSVSNTGNLVSSVTATAISSTVTSINSTITSAPSTSTTPLATSSAIVAPPQTTNAASLATVPAVVLMLSLVASVVGTSLNL